MMYCELRIALLFMPFWYNRVDFLILHSPLSIFNSFHCALFYIVLFRRAENLNYCVPAPPVVVKIREKWYNQAIDYIFP